MLNWEQILQNQNSEIYLWGGGNLCREFLSNSKMNFRVKGIIDINRSLSGKYINDIPIYFIDISDCVTSSHELILHDLNNDKKIILNNKKSCIIITTIFYIEIQDILSKYDFKNVFAYYLKAYSDVDWEGLCHIHPGLRTDDFQYIDQLINVLADDESKYVLQEIIKFRSEGILDYRKIKSKQTEYVDSDIVHFSHNEVIIDGGAYIGDTLEVFNKHIGQWDKIICFEPDNKNYTILKSNLSKYNRVEAIQAALGEKSGICYFNAEHGAGSAISASVTRYAVDVKSIDSLNVENISFIKLDVEGNEISAIQGAQETIRNNKPKLAICLYHRSSDLWNIPLLVKNINKDYKIYIRHYGKHWEDTIMYAL